MYQHALQGYENAAGINNTSTFIPALNTIWDLGSLFEHQADIAKARTMYLKIPIEYEKIFGPNHSKSQNLRDKLHALDVMIENKALVKIEDPVNNPQGGPSHLGAGETISKSKRNNCSEK